MFDNQRKGDVKSGFGEREEGMMGFRSIVSVVHRF